MARSFDPRELPGGPEYDEKGRRAFRGAKRYGGLGRVTPGDELENTRDHERLWTAINGIRRYAGAPGPNSTGGGDSDCCTPSGPGGPVYSTGDLQEVMSTLGTTSWYRLGSDDDFTVPSIPGTVTGAIKDASSHANHMDRVFQAGATDYPSEADALAPTQDGGTVWTFDQQIYYPAGTNQGVGGSGVANGALVVPHSVSGKFTVCGWTQGAITSGSDPTWSPLYRGMPFGCLSVPGGSTIGWGLMFNHFYGYYEVWLSGVVQSGTFASAAPLFHALTDDGAGTVKWYINCNLVQTYSGDMGGGDLAIANGAIKAGINQSDTHFLGVIDEVACFHDDLDADELALIMWGGDTAGTTTGPLNGGIAIQDSSIPEDKLDFDVATQAELDEVADDLADHIADATAAHAASAVSYGGGTGMSATDVEAAIDELATEKISAGAAAIVDADISAAAAIGLAKIAATKRVRVTKSSAQTLTNNTLTVLTFDGETFDTDTMHDNSTNNDRLTFTTAGVYLVVAVVTFNNNSTGFRLVQILDQAGSAANQNNQQAANGDDTTVTVIAVVAAAANDWVQIKARQTSGGDLDVRTTGGGGTIFFAVRLGT